MASVRQGGAGLCSTLSFGCFQRSFCAHFGLSGSGSLVTEKVLVLSITCSGISRSRHRVSRCLLRLPLKGLLACISACAPKKKAARWRSGHFGRVLRLVRREAKRIVGLCLEVASLSYRSPVALSTQEKDGARTHAQLWVALEVASHLCLRSILSQSKNFRPTRFTGHDKQ